METNTVKFRYHGGNNTWFYLVPLGDIHLGNVGCEIGKAKEMIEWIRTHKNTYWIGMGDYIDAINYMDKRFDQTTVAEPYRSNLSNAISNQTRDVIKILMPIKDKCLGLHRGNHEETIRLRTQYDVMYEMWKALDSKLLNDTAITRLSFMDESGHGSAFEIFSTHGSGGGKKGGGIINKLEDMITYVDADVYLQGHVHRKETETKSTLYLDTHGNLKVKKRVLGVTGCFLHGYQEGVSSYVEKWGFPPTDTGAIKLMFNPRKHDVHVSE